jgi:hypothetical protein
MDVRTAADATTGAEQGATELKAQIDANQKPSMSLAFDWKRRRSPAWEAWWAWRRSSSVRYGPRGAVPN